MAFLKRAMLSLLRRPFRAAILCLIITAIGTLELLGLSMRSTAESLKNASLNSIGGQILLSNKSATGTVSIDDLRKYLTNSHIVGYNASVSKLVTPDGFQNAVSSDRSPFAKGHEVDPTQVQLVGDLNVNMDDVFREHQAELIAGKYPDGGGAVINQILADKNQLQIGDSITLRYKEAAQEHSVTLSVVGIYRENTLLMESSMNSDGRVAYTQSLYSKVFTNFNTTKKLLGDSTAVASVTLYVDHIDYLSSVIKLLQSIPDIKDKYTHLDSTGSDSKQMAGIIQIISHDSAAVTLLIFASGVLVLFLAILLWMRDYIYDAGILIAMGEPKGKIALQFLSEMMLLTVVALGCSVLIGKASIRLIAENVTYAVAQLQKRNAVATMSISSSLDFTRLSHIKIEIGTIFAFFGIGLLLVIIPAIVSCLSIFKYRPREILNRAE